MSLKSLELTNLSTTKRTPLDVRKTKTIERLQEQKELLANPNYVRVSKRWVVVEGQKQLVDKARKVQPWWRSGPNGSAVFFIRLGGKPLEFEKGKAGVAVSSASDLPAIVDKLIAAVRDGELDQQLSANEKRIVPPKKRAA